MNQELWNHALLKLPLGGIRYCKRIDSTNNEAAVWAEHGANDLALVIAEEQTAGRGRDGRRWFTPPGTALAFSLVLKRFDAAGNLEPAQILNRLTSLGALATCETLRSKYGLEAQIKWPNDVLLDHRKVAGVLAEAHWIGSHLRAVILGIGVNVTLASVPDPDQVAFPAVCVEAILGRPVDRPELLFAILQKLLFWRQQLGGDQYVKAWEKLLAFRNEWVHITGNSGNGAPNGNLVRIIGLDPHGGLCVEDQNGEFRVLHMGEVHLVLR